MLSDEDIEKLKAVFATKEDLILMEKRFDKKFVTKDDLDLVVKDLVAFVGEVHEKLDGKIEKIDKKIDNIDKKFTRQLNGIERDIRVLNKEVQVLTAYKIISDDHELRLRTVEKDLGIL